MGKFPKAVFAILTACLPVALLGCILITFPAAAEESSEKISVVLNDEILSFEQEPFIKDGTTLVPARTILEKLGYTVTWDEMEKAVKGSKLGVSIRMRVGYSVATVNDREFLLDKAPLMKDGVTFIPVRFVAESSNTQVSWEQEDRRVGINADVKETDNEKIIADIENYAYSKSAYDFVFAITRSRGVKYNNFEVKEIVLNENRNEAKVIYILDYDVFEAKLINTVAIASTSWLQINIEITDKVILDEGGNWRISEYVADRKYEVTVVEDFATLEE